MSQQKIQFAKSGKQFKLFNVPVYWAQIQTPVPKYKKPNELEFAMNTLIEEDILEQLEENNINKSPKQVKAKNKARQRKGKEPSYGSKYDSFYDLNLTSPATWRDGTPRHIVVLKDSKPFYDLVGNESICDVVCRIGRANDDGLRTIYLEKVIVKDLVEYENDDEFAEEGEDEFEAPSSDTSNDGKTGNSDEDDFDEDDFDDDDLAF